MRALSKALFCASLVSMGATVAACGEPGLTTGPSMTATATTGNGGAGAAGGKDAGGAGGAGGQGGIGGPGGAGGAMGVDTCGIGAVPGGGAGGASSAGPVRVVAANLSSGTKQSYDPGHGLRILQGLDADVVLLQEMNIGANSPAVLDGLVEDVCEGECNYIRGPEEQIPNGVVSRLPILECGSWIDPEVANRNFVWARIDIAGDADLWAISVHLLTTSATKRNAEAAALLGHIGRTIPTTDLIVLGGDLNTEHRGEAAVATLADVFETAGPHPADHDDNDMTNEARSKPYDWVLADAELAPHQTPVIIGASVFPDGAVIDTRAYMPLSEIAPAQLADSGAPGMQHMAVVKDFALAPP